MTDLGAGDLDNRLIIEAETRTPNGQGGFVTTWTESGRMWAQVLALRGDEALRQAVERSTQLWKVTTRFRRDVTTKHRLRRGDLVMNIRQAADPDGRRTWLVMTAESGVPT